MFVVPEVGGDAGISAVKMIRAFSPSSKIYGLDCNEANASYELAETLVCPEVINPSQIDQNLLDHLTHLLSKTKNSRVILCPTSESMTLTLIELVCTTDLDIHHWLPSKEAFLLSRDKKMLAQKDWACSELSRHWRGEVFRKPVSGVGSRGCFKARSPGVIHYMFEDSILLPILSGPEIVVDVVGREAFSREVFSQKGGQDVSIEFS